MKKKCSVGTAGAKKGAIGIEMAAKTCLLVRKSGKLEPRFGRKHRKYWKYYIEHQNIKEMKKYFKKCPNLL